MLDQAIVLSLLKEAIWMIMKLSAPMLISGLILGVIISLFQALTQIQEQTLTFVPKLMVVFAVFIFVMPFFLGSLEDFALDLFKIIESQGVTGGR